MIRAADRAHFVPANDHTRQVPACKISLDGQPLAADARAALATAEVELDVDLFGRCTLTFTDPKLALINGKLFASGAAVKVELGYAAKLQRVFEGEVVALEPQFLRDRPPSLRVVCLEPLHRLALSQMTRSFNDVDEGQIATRIAQEHGLTAEAPSGTRQHVLQGNVTDAAWLRRMAASHGNTLRIEGKKLIIGPPPSGAQISISPAETLKKARIRIDGRGQVGEISVHAWDRKAKQEIVGKAKGEGETGEGARKLGGSARISFAGHELVAPDVATAEKIAKGRMRKLAEGFVTAVLELIGDARLVVGALLSLERLGTQVEGTYRVDHAVHHWSKHGYSVTCKAVRVSKKTAAAAAQQKAAAQAARQEQPAQAKEEPPPDELRATVGGSAGPVMVEVSITAAPDVASVEVVAQAEPDLHHLDAEIKPG